MNQNLLALAKDNMIRVSPLKLSLIANSIVNKKVSVAINQLKFSEKRVSRNVLKVLNAAIANAENNNSSPQNIMNEKSVESEEKKFGTQKGLKKENIESGSIKGTGVEKITCLKCLEPKYPKLAIKKGYEGTLKLKITIMKNGLVKDVLIKESTGYNILDKSGIYAAKNSKFYPLSKETNLDIEYKLELN